MSRSTSLIEYGLFVLGLSALSTAAGCQLVAGLGGEEPLTTTGNGGNGGTGASGGNGGTGAMGGSGGTTGSTSDTGGSGGTGLTGPCSPGEKQDCYTGPDGTEGKGLCAGGQATCTDEGMWGACNGEVLPALESCAAAADEDCNGHDCTVWVKMLEGAIYGGPVAIDGDGNILVSVAFFEGIDFGDGQQPAVPVGNGDVAVVKFDKTGKIVWKRVFPAAGQQDIEAIAVDASGNIAIGGSSDSDINFGTGVLGKGVFVAKLDPAGTTLWATRGTGTSSGLQPHIAHVAFDSMGNVIAGGSGAAVDWGNGMLAGGDSTNLWVAKLDGVAGMASWSKISKGGASEYLHGLAVDPSNSVVLLASWNGAYLGLAGPPQAAPNDHYNCCQQQAPFLVRIEPNGTSSVADQLGGYGDNLQASLSDLAVDKFGTATIVGSFSGDFDLPTGPYAAGTIQSLFVYHEQVGATQDWGKVLIGDLKVGTFASHVGVDSKDNIVVSGTYYGPADFGFGPLPMDYNAYVAKLDKTGKPLWSHAYKFGDGGIQGLATGTDEDETVLVGTFYSEGDLGTGLVSAQQRFFIARLGH